MMFLHFTRRSPLRPILALALLIALLLSPTAAASTYLERSPEEMALAADLIFVAEVDAVRVVVEEGEPWTEVDFRIEEWVADARRATGADAEGSEPPASESLRFLGGAVPGGERLTVSGVPRYQVGQRVLLFAYEATGLASPVVGFNQGSWVIGAAGALDASGERLSVPAPGRLQRGGGGAEVAEIGKAITALRESGILPDEPLPEESPPEEGSPEEALPEVPQAEEPPADEPPADEPQAEAPQPADPPAQPTEVGFVVDESGGPLRLVAAAREAAAAWEAAADGEVVLKEVEAGSEGAAAAPLIAYGDAELFGPDALSLTLVSSGSEPIRVLIDPTGDRLVRSLLHELGVLLGLQETAAGVMASAVREGEELRAPTAADVAALRSLRTYHPADLNRDGVVDFYDLAIFAAAYGSSGVNLPADLNGDGTVNDADLALLEEAYQFLPPSEQAQ